MRSQDAPLLLGQLLNSSAQDKTLDRAHRRSGTPSVERLGDFQGVPDIVSALGGFCSAEKGADIRAFFAAHPVPAAARGLQQALERIDACVALDQRQSAPFTPWLAAQPKS